MQQSTRIILYYLPTQVGSCAQDIVANHYTYYSHCFFHSPMNVSRDEICFQVILVYSTVFWNPGISMFKC